MGLCLPLRAYPLQNLTTNVNLFCGTAGGGNAADLFPGAVVPFGMIQWSPDTTNHWPSCYLYSDTQIHGFGLTHASGAGCNYGGDLGFTPFLGSVASSPYDSTYYCHLNASYFSTFSHANEFASPGYYSVQFTNGVRTELTTTTRTGFGRFTYPSGNTASMLINAGGDGNGTINASIQINAAGNEVSGWTQMPGMCGTASATLYFDVVFDRAFTAYGTWNGGTLAAMGTSAAGANTGVYLSFNLPSGGVVLARTAVSYVSVANAQANLAAENPVSGFTSVGFDAMTNAATTNWNGFLNKIQVSGGAVADTKTFYTMLYHCLIAPEVVSDANGQYRGFDGIVHTLSVGHSKYEWFSGWDIYRSECQLIALMDPDRASDMAQSLVLDSQEGGAMPRWSIAVADSAIMLGDPATPIIAGMYAFGATNFNTSAALAAMAKAATNPITKAKNGVIERDANRDYLNLGFVPEYQIGSYACAAMTLEYCSADFALARFAKAIGDTDNYTSGMNRAQNWRNLYNTTSGYFQMRRSYGLWSPGFISNASTYDGYNLWAEGTGSQYIWMVPFNLGSLVSFMGGPQAASARLDTFFTQINDNNTGSGQYAYLGNEPCAATPWVYHYVGQPYKASSVVRRAVTQLFSTSTSGLPGNDDLGQMSAWYVWAVLGMYPELPGDDVLVLHGPLFPQAVLHLANGDVTITGTGAAANAPYVQSLTVNGQPSSAAWVRFTNIANGGTLAYVMGTTANTNWGSNPLSAPPSYTDGMTNPVAQTCVWGTGLESSEMQTTWNNTVDYAAPGGGSNNIAFILGGAGSPELGVRSETSQSGTYEIVYSGRALGGATDYAYLKAFDLSGQGIVISSGMRFSYWIYPQSGGNTTGSNSTFVALDIIFADGTTLRDSNLTDQRAVRVHPTYQGQGGQLVLDTWNYVTVDLTPLAGKTVDRVDLGFDKPNGSGGYRGYVDDIGFTTPAPTGLSAFGGYGMVNLSWTGSAGVTSYNVKRSTSSGAETLITNVTTTSFTDLNVVNGMKYYYMISAVTLAGENGNSAEVSAIPMAPAPGSYAAAIASKTPLAYWPLSETNGSIAYDIVGGRNGTYVGGVTLGQPGVTNVGFVPSTFAPLFNGTSGYVDIPTGPFNITNAITTIAWVKVPAIPHFSGIMGRGDSSWRMTVNGSGNPAAANGGSGDATSPASIVGNSWHMVAYTYTGVPGVANNGALYVDGVLKANNTVLVNTGSLLDVYIGGAPDYGTGRLLPGSIAHATIFTNALSAAQITALYNTSLVAPIPKLTITPSGSGSLTVIWWQGLLQQATNVSGPWITNMANSPYLVVPTNFQTYFRTRL